MAAQSKPRYSIILPVRNGGNYVKLCLNSILSQTLNAFNLIVLDNDSTDGTLEYITSLRDDRIVIYPSSTPLTIEENWSRISGVNKNEFITLIGHDDILFPEYLAQMDLLINTYPQASLYQGHFTYINAQGKYIRSCKPMSEIEDGSLFLKTVLQNKIDIMGTGFIMRSANFDRLGGMPMYPNLIFSDLELWIKITNLSFKATTEKVCFSFRIHQGTTNITSDLKFQQALDKFVHFLISLKTEKMQFAEVIENYSNRFLLFYCKGLSHRLLRTPKKERDGLSVKGFLQKYKHYSKILETKSVFEPIFFPSIFLAQLIDSSGVGRLLFLTLKKVYKKAFLK